MNTQEFIQTAHESVYRTGPKDIDYSRSLLLYSPQAEKLYEKLQTNDSGYGKEITENEIDFLKSIAPDLMSRFPFGINYIDLGPGTEYRKQQIFLDTLARYRSNLIEYCAVDVNREMAGRARDYIKRKSPMTKSYFYEADFESMDKNCFPEGNKKVKNFYNFLGLMSGNFKFSQILKIINSCLINYSDYFFIDFQPKKYALKNIAKTYKNSAPYLIQQKMSLLGFKKNDYQLEITDEVKVYAHILNTENCTHSEIKTGDRLLVFMSIRYSIPEIKERLNQYYRCTFYDNEKFFGALLQKK